MAVVPLIDVGSGIASALTTSTGKAWYYGAVPADAVAPFGRVSIVTGSWPRSLARIPAAVSQVIQLTAAGKTDEDIGWLLDKARTYFDGVQLPLAVSTATEIVGAVPESPPSAPIREGTLLSMSEDYRLLIGSRL